MQDKNLYWKVGLILLILLWSAYEIYPFDKKLKGGIDLVGGHSLLYEIDTSDNPDIANLSTEVMKPLKVRVDPDGVRNLVWRPVGDTRLEIQMPLPPAETTEKRNAFMAAMDKLRDTNVRISDIERALTQVGPNRDRAVDALVRDVPERKQLLEGVVQAYDALHDAMTEKKDRAVIEDLEQAYELALDKLLVTNIDLRQVNDTLDLQRGLSERDEGIAKLKEKYPSRVSLLNAAVAAYNEWAGVKGPLDDPEDLKRLLRGQGVLEFHILAVPSADKPDEFSDYAKRLAEKGPRIRPGDRYAWYEVAKPDDFHGGFKQEWGGKTWVLAYYNDPRMVMDFSRGPWTLTRASATTDSSGMPAVQFRFDESGGSRFYQLTRENVGKPLCIILDKLAISAPNIQSAISTVGTITGRFTNEEVRYLINTLNAGSLVARLKDNPISTHSIGPSLGEDNRHAGFRAAYIGLIAVMLFMAVYYMWAGAIADVALFMNLLILLGVMAALQATFTMAGIAGIILTMGMAVDANVLIYERMREETQKLQSLRLIIKNGYDRALPTILDANVTTLITCVVLYYIGTEEIKGFALTLGLGLVISLFTALFASRTIFTLLSQRGLIRSLPMMKLFTRPNINWLAKQKYFWSISIILLIVGITSFPLRGQDKYDIEFRGGTSVQIELKSPETIENVREQVRAAGAVLTDSRDAIRQARLQPAPNQERTYTLTFQNVPAERVQAALQSFMDDCIEKGSLRIAGSATLTFRIKYTFDTNKHPVAGRIADVAEQTYTTGEQLSIAQVQSVGDENLQYEIVTTATSQPLVMNAIVTVMGDQLNIQQAIQFDPKIKTYPITSKWLREVIGDPTTPGYVGDYSGGAAFVVDKIDPAVTTAEVRRRVVTMCYQPDFEKLQWRDFNIIGLTAAPGQDLTKLSEDQIQYTRVAMVVSDPNFPYDEDEALWQSELVAPQLELLRQALGRTSELQKVTQFAGQVARQAKVAAILALIVAFGGIIMYLWIRFGTPRHGIAAVIALLHDVTVCLAFVALAAILADTPIGKLLMLQDFKINLALVAAFLTVIGYSVNDTIVVYDRIRENQGKLTAITPKIMNDSFNQTLSRTVLTSLTTLIVMVIMYVFGGEGVHGFSFVMIIGTIVGTYSSIAIASPLLLGWRGGMTRAASST